MSVCSNNRTRLALASVLGPLGIHFCTFVRSYGVHFIVHLVHFEFNLEAEWTDPSQKRSIKFSAGLPQPAYAFVSDIHERSNKQRIEPS